MPRCTLTPLPDQQVSFEIDGVERLRWHGGAGAPRPFFYPLLGPASGRSLTRMGHPGAPDHDHHRSVWFAHHKVAGADGWSDQGPVKVRQTAWHALQDGADEAVFAATLAWQQDGRTVMTQDLFAAVRPGPGKETFLELQSTFKPAAGTLELGKTNFGFLAVRVSKDLSAVFGNGKLTNADGKVGEKACFGQTAAWMDYSGKNAGHDEGVAFHDHPTNPGHPTAWHVRDDGWMGAAACFSGPRTLTEQAPLTLRYLLHAHAGLCDPERFAAVAKDFAARPPLELVPKPAPHQRFGVRRAK